MASRYGRPLIAAALLCAVPAAGCDGRGGVPAGPGAGVGADALPDLVRSLKLRDPAARARAATALGRMGPAAKEAVPGLAAALKDRDLSVRAAAAYALGRIGPEAKPALPALEAAAREKPLREIATGAIEAIGR